MYVIRLEMWTYLLMKVNAVQTWDIKILLFGEDQTYSYLIEVSFFVKLKICMCLLLILNWISWYKYGDGTKYKVFINYNNEQKNCAEIKSK